MRGMRGMADADARDFAAGLQSSMDAINHVSKQASTDTATKIAESTDFNKDPDGWSLDVRSAIYMSEFFTAFSMQPGKATDGKLFVDIFWEEEKLHTITRPNQSEFEDQAEIVENAKIQRIDRSDEIISQLGPFDEFFAIILGLNEVKHPYTYELMGIIQDLSGDACMPIKHMFAVPRPEIFNPRIAPLIEFPGHGSFPSAHATQSHALMTVLNGLIDLSGFSLAEKAGRKRLVEKQADRITYNRTVAGVHFPADNDAGSAFGKKIGEKFLELGNHPADSKSKLATIAWLFKKVKEELVAVQDADYTNP